MNSPAVRFLTWFVAAFCALAFACTEEDAGSISILLEPETTILDGILPGDDVEHIRDGWEVRFDKYVAVVGDVLLKRSNDQQVTAQDRTIYAVDLHTLPANGITLWGIEDLASVRWDFTYALSGGIHGALQHESVSDSDFHDIVDHDWSYLIEGSIINVQGVTCPPPDVAEPGSIQSTEERRGVPCYPNPEISFRFALTAETLYGPCEIDGVPGVAVPSGGTASVAISIHGDHVFFNGFPEGSEGGVMRLAQWLADSDLNLDGQVSQQELESITPSDLVHIDERYQLGGSPLTLDTMWDYVASQLKTQGHYQGEGECPADGLAHNHSH